ncbi:MAG: N(5)-(carboxyethyl)ornithine synthase [Candidatus Cloacimonetes bacterium]|nr:N(5)-(carboxyethyl)ornithine synthase [Candidatus Cloacimonadota bacterium]
MKIGFIKPQSPGEKRVVLLPEDIGGVIDELYFEKGYGSSLGIEDIEYLNRGARIRNRKEIFASCDGIFSLKPIETEDYELVRDRQVFIGGQQPQAAGKDFFDTLFLQKDLYIIDTDIKTRLYHRDKIVPVKWVQDYFSWENSVMAGYAAIYHATLSHGILITPQTRIAVLGTGNVAQGAFKFSSQLGAKVRMFYRRTLKDFKYTLGLWDIIVSGIKLDDPSQPVLSREDQRLLKPGCLVIDAAGEAGVTFAGTHFTNLENPIYEEDRKFYYIVTNTPALFYRSISELLSQAFRLNIFDRRLQDYINLV